MNLRVNLNCPTFCQLEHRTKTLYVVQTNHGYRHAALAEEVGRETAATEVVTVSWIPGSCLQALIYILLGHLPRLLHDWVALGICSLTCTVECGSTRVDQVDDTTRCLTCKFLTGNTLHCLWTPVGTNVAEDLSTTCQQVIEQHCYAVACIILSSEDNSFTDTVPVE